VKFGKLVDKEWEDKTAKEILAAPPSALEGLTPKHDEKLAELGIKTVEQLANWKYVKRARALADLADTDV
jgi:predicted flap endonuclease-1-like 5' DNA nuclease